MVKPYLKLELVVSDNRDVNIINIFSIKKKFRIKEGEESGLTEEDYKASVATLDSIATTLEADCVMLRERTSECGMVGQYLIRHRAEQEDFVEIRYNFFPFRSMIKIHEALIFDVNRVAVVGNVDAGKSTLLGVLTHGDLDNGRGLARQKLFRHKHEIETGRTSSVGNDILGFDSSGNVVNEPEHGSLDWVKICSKATKVVTFIDLAGHEKYLKTTVFGMTGHAPDFTMLMVIQIIQTGTRFLVTNNSLGWGQRRHSGNDKGRIFFISKCWFPI